MIYNNQNIFSKSIKSIHKVKDILQSFQDSFTMIIIRNESDSFFFFFYILIVPECEEAATHIISDS